jgi:hypothetical protein
MKIDLSVRMKIPEDQLTDVRDLNPKIVYFLSTFVSQYFLKHSQTYGYNRTLLQRLVWLCPDVETKEPERPEIAIRCLQFHLFNLSSLLCHRL